jgi:hypothetical protein
LLAGAEKNRAAVATVVRRSDDRQPGRVGDAVERAPKGGFVKFDLDGTKPSRCFGRKIHDAVAALSGEGGKDIGDRTRSFGERDLRRFAGGRGKFKLKCLAHAVEPGADLGVHAACRAREQFEGLRTESTKPFFRGIAGGETARAEILDERSDFRGECGRSCGGRGA